MASIGSLVVNLTAKTDKFNRNINKAQTRVQRFAGVAKKALKAGIVAALAAAGAAAAATAAQFKKLDEIAKTSDKLGIAAEKMGGLSFAFQQTGVDAKAGMVALQRMTRRIADARNGAGPAAKSIKQLGLSAEELAKKSPEDALGDIADAMKGVQNQGEKVRLAFSLFDAEGVGLVNTLAGGSKGLKDFQREAESLGLSHTREELAKIEEANDAWNRSTQAMIGGLQELAITIAPAVTAVSGLTTDIIKGWIGISKWVGVATGFTDSLSEVARKTPPATATVEDMTAELDRMAASADHAKKKAEDFAEAMKTAAGQRFDFQADQLEDFKTKLQDLRSPAEVAAQDLAEFVKQVQKFSVPADRQNLINQFIDNQSGFKSAIDAARDELGLLQGSITKTDLILQQLGEKGASIQQIEEMRAVLAEIDAIKNKPKTAKRPQQFGPQQFAGVIQKGSAEAFSLAVRASTGKDSPVKEQKKTNGILRGMAKVMARQRERDLKLSMREQGAV